MLNELNIIYLLYLGNSYVYTSIYLLYLGNSYVYTSIYLLYLGNSYVYTIVFFSSFVYNVNFWPEDGQARPKHVVTIAAINTKPRRLCFWRSLLPTFDIHKHNGDDEPEGYHSF
jgi:hypothetical protein